MHAAPSSAPPAARDLPRFGAAAAALACAFAIAYAIPQVLAVTVWSPPEWLEVAAIMAPSLGIAIFFVPTIVAIHERASPDRRHLTLTAVAFAAMYAALAGLVYMTQLGVVVPRLHAGDAVDAEVFRVADGTLLTMADAIAYSFMSVSAGLAAFAFGGSRLGRWTRGALLAHGALAPVIALAAVFPWMLAIGMLWLVTGPLGLGLVAATFARDAREAGAGARAPPATTGGKPSA